VRVPDTHHTRARRRFLIPPLPLGEAGRRPGEGAFEVERNPCTLTPTLSQREREYALTPTLSQREREYALTPTLSQREREYALTPTLSQREREYALTPALSQREREYALSQCRTDLRKSRRFRPFFPVSRGGRVVLYSGG
jgi:hypothetical protein